MWWLSLNWSAYYAITIVIFKYNWKGIQHYHYHKKYEQFDYLETDLPSLTVLPWGSRFWLESHGLTERHKILTVKWHLPSVVLTEGYFHNFENENNPIWSSVILPVQTGNFRNNSWVSVASLLDIGCWFHSLIFRLDVFSMLQKQKFAFPVSLSNQRNLSMKVSFAENTRNNEWRYPRMVSMYSVKTRGLKYIKLPSYIELSW